MHEYQQEFTFTGPREKMGTNEGQERIQGNNQGGSIYYGLEHYTNKFPAGHSNCL